MIFLKANLTDFDLLRQENKKLKIFLKKGWQNIFLRYNVGIKAMASESNGAL